MNHIVTFAKAINEAFQEEMRKDTTIFHFGEDIRFNQFVTTAGLAEEFGESRVLHAPISESNFVNAGIGAAIMGLRPIIEIMYSDFLLLACDSIVSEAATWRYVHGHDFILPMVIRAASVGSGMGGGAYHAKNVESTFLHYPGIKIAYPSTPYDSPICTGRQSAAVSLYRQEKEKATALHRMHWGIPGVPGGERGDGVRRETKDIIEKRCAVEINGIECICPSEYHHCLVMLTHTAGHMIKSGVGLRHICDWAVFADKVDIAQWEAGLRRCGLWRFAQMLTQLSTRYLYLPEQSWAIY